MCQIESYKFGESDFGHLTVFGQFLSKNTVIFDDFSPKKTKVRPKYVSWGYIQDGVAITGIWYVDGFGVLGMPKTQKPNLLSIYVVIYIKIA